MKKVDVLERFDVSWGITFIVSEGYYKVGDVFCDQYNEVYTIENIIMPTRPSDDKKLSLVVKKGGI